MLKWYHVQGGGATIPMFNFGALKFPACSAHPSSPQKPPGVQSRPLPAETLDNHQAAIHGTPESPWKHNLRPTPLGESTPSSWGWVGGAVCPSPRGSLGLPRPPMKGSGGLQLGPEGETHAALGVAHAAHEGRGLLGAGTHGLRPALPEEPRHGGLVGEAEVAPVLQGGGEDRRRVRRARNLRHHRGFPGAPLGSWAACSSSLRARRPLLTRKCASCRAIWMKLSGLVRHFLISPLPKALKQKQQKSTSSASAWASPYDASMAWMHCGERHPERVAGGAASRSPGGGIPPCEFPHPNPHPVPADAIPVFVGCRKKPINHHLACKASHVYGGLPTTTTSHFTQRSSPVCQPVPAF